MFWKKKLANNGKKILILYGTRSGNSKLIAEQTEALYSENGIAVEVASMKNYKPEDLQHEKKVLVVVSTHGEGHPPAQAKHFFKTLMGDEMVQLDELEFSICALGDSGYTYFCKAGKDVEQRFIALGAKTIYPRVDCDVDFTENAIQWIKGSFQVIANSLTPQN